MVLLLSQDDETVVATASLVPAQLSLDDDQLTEIERFKRMAINRVAGASATYCICHMFQRHPCYLDSHVLILLSVGLLTPCAQPLARREHLCMRLWDARTCGSSWWRRWTRP